MKIKLLIFVVSLLIITYSCQNSSTANSTAVDAETIIKQINKNKPVYYKDVVIKGTLDFTQIKNISPENVNIARAYISVPVTFVNCTFENPVKAFGKAGENVVKVCTFEKNLTFFKCTFNDEISFRESIVAGHCNFTSCVFKKNAGFEGMSFMAKNTFFTESVFEGEARFQSIFALGSIGFLRATFKDNVNFSKSKFKSDAQFGAISCMKGADFNSISASENFLCRYAKFIENASFNNSTFAQIAEFNEMEVNTIDFTEVQFSGISKWNDTKVMNKIIFTGAHFMQSNPDDSVLKLETNAKIQRNKE